MALKKIDRDTLIRIFQDLDENADGRVSKAEFKVPYMKLNPGLKNEDFDKVWDTIDKNKDGELSRDELAAHYGFNLSPNAIRKGAEADAMSDDQILEALRMQDTLADMKAQTDAKRAALNAAQDPANQPRRTSLTGEIKPRTLSSGVKVIKIPPKVTIVEDPIILFMQACDAGDVKVITKHLEDDGPCRIEDEKGESALHKISKHNLVGLLRKLIDKCEKRDINQPDRNGNTPIFNAAECGHTEMVNTLLDRGADTAVENNQGWTVLHAAVNSNMTDVVSAILSHPFVDKKAIVNQTDRTKRSPLHIAAFKTNEDLVQLLLSHGADHDLKDGAGNLPVCIAKKAGRKKSRELLEVKTSQAAG